jgi:hypothetical protein
MIEVRTLHELLRMKGCLRCICRRCRHGALLFPMTIGEEHGWHLTVHEISRRLRCSRCQSSSVNVYEALR